jgi:uncharacterized protein (TIGR02996 family)
MSPARSTTAASIDAKLLAEVLASPMDDAPRLVLADVLQENGDPRGDFIVAQCRLAESGLSPDERALLKRRSTSLLGANDASWMAAAKGVGRSVMRRGFIDEVEATAAELEKTVAKLFSTEPITRLTVTGVTAKTLAALADGGAFARVRRLTLRGVLGEEGTHALSAALSKRATPLVSLNVGGTSIEASGFGALVRVLEGCRSLVLTSNAIGDDGLEALGKA